MPSGLFKLSDSLFRAERMPQKFSCRADGMRLEGMAFDWRILREDGQTFPLPDHLFRLLFRPVDATAREAFNANIQITLNASEGTPIKDTIVALKSKFKNILNR